VDRIKKSRTQIALEYWLARAVVASLEFAPLAFANALARFYARVLDLAVPRLRRIALRNLSMAMPNTTAPERRRIVNGVFHSIARLLVAFARFPSITPANISQWIRYQGYEHFENARLRGKGVLFATAHLGNWELSAFCHAILSRPMHIVVRPLDNPRIDAMVEARRALSGNHIDGKRDLIRPILKALRANEAVGILVDQNSSLDGGVFADFFGIPACVNTSFAKLAAHSGAAVIPGFALWSESERKYILRFYPEVPISGDPAQDTRAIQKTLESAIAEYPDQWLWIHRRWKTRPPNEPSLYNDL
jgi:KDO2-lipid IV(A) lauroyltransferase